LLSFFWGKQDQKSECQFVFLFLLFLIVFNFFFFYFSGNGYIRNQNANIHAFFLSEKTARMLILFSFHQFALPFLGKQHQKSERQFVSFITSFFFFFSFSGRSYIRNQNANVDFSFQGIAARMLILFFHFREKQLTSEIELLLCASDFQV